MADPMEIRFSEFMEHQPETLEKIAKRLDRVMKGIKNWRHFAWEINADSSLTERLKWYGNFSPTIRVFEHLEAVEPNLTILEVKNALLHIGREDMHQLLKEVDDQAKACDVLTPNLLTELAQGLDRTDGVVGNWFMFATRLRISKENCQQFQKRILENPTCRLFEYLEKTQRGLTLQEVEMKLRSIKRNNLAELLWEVINQEGNNRLVKDVITPESELLEKISNKLNQDVPGTGNWRNLAAKLNIPRHNYEQFESPEGHEKPSPTMEILKWMVGRYPDITIGGVVEIMRNIERMDVIEEIENVAGELNLFHQMINLNLEGGAITNGQDREDAAEASSTADEASPPPPYSPSPTSSSAAAAAGAQAPAPAPSTADDPSASFSSSLSSPSSLSSSSSSSAVASSSPPPPSTAAAAAAAAAAAVPADAIQVFLSYQWDLQPIVENLKERLEANGITCWMDVSEMGPGDVLRAEIDAGIRNCKVFISCMNKKYCDKSKLCPLEATLAKEVEKPIIPLLLEDIGPWPPGGQLSLVFTGLIYERVKDTSGGIPEQHFARILKQVQKYIGSN